MTAEGVETAGQLEFPRELGCDLARSYYFARPLPTERIQGLPSVPAAPVGARTRRATLGRTLR